MKGLRFQGAGLFGAAVACALAGCSSMNPFDQGYHPPPAANSSLDVNAPIGNQTVVVIGELENPPTASVRWRDIGTGMTDALVRTLRNEKNYSVRMDRRLGSDIQSTLLKSAGDRFRRLEEFHKKYPDIDFVVIGQVTDFQHSTDLPDQAQQRTFLFGRKSEAIVAIRLTVVDVVSGNVVVDDHVTGTASSSKDVSSKDLYRNISFGSYVFWNTPLGEASMKTINDASLRIQRAVPLLQGDPMIVRVLDPRKVQLNAGKKLGVTVGQQYYVCTPQPGGDYVSIKDADTGQPLMAKVTSVEDDEAEAWLVGRAPLENALWGAHLRRTPPAAPPVKPAANSAASVVESN